MTITAPVDVELQHDDLQIINDDITIIPDAPEAMPTAASSSAAAVGSEPLLPFLILGALTFTTMLVVAVLLAF